MSQVLPKPIENLIIRIRDRVKEVKKTYGSLAKYGYPILESRDEVIALIYTIKELGFSANEIAKMLGLDKSTVYKLVKKFERGENITIFNKEKKTLEGVSLTLDDVKKTVEEWLKPRAKKWIKDVTEASCIIEFMKNPVKIQRKGKHSLHYTRSQVVSTINKVNELCEFILTNKERLRNILGKEIPSNPDLWDDEDAVFQVIRIMCHERYPSDDFKARVCERTMMQMLKRIPRFREWFKGRIGTVRDVIRPKESTLYYEHYLRLKKLAKESGDRELLAFWLISGLHIEAGTREGWSSLELQIERAIADGIQVNIKPKDIWSLDLDHDLVNTSLIGIKWEHAIWSPDGELLGFRIWEEKTKKWWELRIPWLDKELHEKWKEVYEWAKHKGYKSVVKSILLYCGVKPRNSKGKWTVSAFRAWYSRMCKKLKELLNLPWDMTPHRLRSAHISILAEFRIPMELVLHSAGNTGFGVGWDDLSTAVIFYMRFSMSLINEYLQQAEVIKQKIAQQIA